MQNKILLSVVIPVYKRTPLVKRAIYSVLNQGSIDSGQLEIIICDDEKNPEKRNANKKIFVSISPRIKYFKNRYEEGPGGNRQTGLELSKGRFLVFLDSDDELKQDFVKVLKHELTVNRKLSAVYCFSDLVYANNFDSKYTLKLKFLNLVKNICLRLSLYTNHRNLFPSSFYLLQISHLMFRRSSIKGFKFNYEYRHGGEDWDLFLFILKNGLIKIVPRKLVTFYYTPESSTSQKINTLKKWKSYSLLASRIPAKFKISIFYVLFLMYISLFQKRYEK